MKKEILEKKLKSFVEKCSRKGFSFLGKGEVLKNFDDFLSILEEKDPYTIGATFSFYTGTKENVGVVYSIHYFKNGYPSNKEMKGLFYTKNVTYKKPDERVFSKQDDLF